MIKKIIFIFLIFSLFSNVTNASQKYKYICDTDKCYSTNNDFVTDNIYYLSNVTETSTDNFSELIDSKFSYFTDYYDGISFSIDGYCEGTCDEISNKNFTLKDLYSYNKSFKIGKSTYFSGIIILKSYDNGKDYIFDNFTSIIDKLHVGFPYGDKKNKLSDIFSNILTYKHSGNFFELKNICLTDSCLKSQNALININNKNHFVFIRGIIKFYNTFVTDTFKVSDNYNISNYLIKAGDSVDFNFGFEDYLDQLIEKTEYEYRIYYNYEGDLIPDYDNFFIKEKIFIDKNFNVTSENIENSIIGNYIDLKILDYGNKKVRVGVKEGINLTKAGKVNFYLAVKNITSGDNFNIKLVNSVFLKVLPDDILKDYESEITYPTFNSNSNSEASGYSTLQPFEVKVKLLDKYKNIHTDNISGYDISISDGSSGDILLGSIKDGEYYGNISGIKSNGDYLTFYFKIPKAGYHKLKGFNIKAKVKQDSTNYTYPLSYNILKNVIPFNLYDGENLMNIYIKPNVSSELTNIKCGQTVNINFVCTSDNLSGCNILKNTNSIYTKENENGSTGKLTISDNAYNVREYNYVMNHIDRTAPFITIRKGELFELDSGNTYNYKANSDPFNILFEEKTTENCKASVIFEIKINDVLKYSGKLNGKDTLYSIDKFFEKSGINKVEVIALDEYNNKSNKIVYLNIYPDKIDPLKSIVDFKSSFKNSLYGNYFDNYNYELKLRDKYSNPIYNKNIVALDTNCDGISGCDNLGINLGNGEDAIIETYSSKTTNDGIVNLALKSYVPGLFKEIFKIRMYDWNEKYIDTTVLNTYTLGSFLNTNSFKNPVKANLSILEGGKVPEIGINQKYQISLNELSGKLAYSLGNISILDSTIINKIEGHFWNSFNLIENDFGNDFNKFLGFSGSIDANENILSGVNLLSKELPITYKIGGKIVKYYLDDFGINGCNTETLGLKVLGSIQGNGKSELTGQQGNFSDISKLDIRGTIRTNGFKLIKGLKNGQVVNGVKYVKGDINLSGNISGYETLIVHNGNVIIDGDLNLSGKKLGIIVLKDNYVVDSDYHRSGNIYVNKNVLKINAIIYADGGFFSSKPDGTNYQDIELNKLLTLNGSLFTRNTIGGAVKGNTSYTLPGGSKTTNYTLAQRYDLNYIRKVPNQCTSNENYSFLIKYDSKVQSNPPIGFSN